MVFVMKKVGQIVLIFWFNICQVGSNQVRVNQVGGIWVGGIWLNLNFRILVPSFFNFKTILAPRVFGKAVVSSVFKYCFTIPWRTPGGKIWYPCGRVEYSKESSPLPCGSLPQMVPGGFIHMLSFPLRPIPPLRNSVKLSRMPRETLWFSYQHMAMVEVSWLECMAGFLLVVLFNLTSVRLKGCKPPITIFQTPKVQLWAAMMPFPPQRG